MIALHAAVAVALYAIWALTTDDKFIVESLLRPEYLDDNYQNNITYAIELKGFIVSAFISLTLWSIIVSFLWLALSSLAPIERPGQAKKLSWLWVLLMAVGICGAVCVFGYYFELGGIGGEIDLLSDDRKLPITLAWVFVFLFYYTFCGSFFTTPRIARTAVPLAARVFRR